MNNSALRLFVRSIIAEAKEKKAKEDTKKSVKKDTKKAEPKKAEPKKSEPKKAEPKKEESNKKSSGKLVDLKKEVAYLRQMSEQLQEMGLNESEEMTEVEFSNLQKFVNELAKVKQSSADLKKKLDEEITATEAKIQDEKNKIKEMMGLVPEGGVEEARFKKGTDIGKPGKGFEKIAKSAAKKYGSEEAGKRVAGAVLKKVVKKEALIGGINYDAQAEAEIKSVVGNIDKITPYVLDFGDKVAMDNQGNILVYDNNQLKKKFPSVESFLQGIKYSAIKLK